jgi:acyl-[acyl-carrier-protein]-phospholipid O-acyltransferase/long-chain-fatty-acid--[acyl-carrier-protein] ligase
MGRKDVLMYILFKVKQRIVQLIIKLFFHYRVNRTEAFPRDPAVIVANHASYEDPFYLLATLPLLTLFFMDNEELANAPCRRLLVLAGVVGVDFNDLKSVIRFTEIARLSLAAGESVCLFPEEKITRTGFLNEFHDIFTAITSTPGIPIVPVYIDIVKRVGKTGSGHTVAATSLLHRSAITVVFGAACMGNVRPVELRQKVAELSCTAFKLREKPRHSMLAFKTGHNEAIVKLSRTLREPLRPSI